MVPMLTCGLVRSNFAFATGVLLRTFWFANAGCAGGLWFFSTLGLAARSLRPSACNSQPTAGDHSPTAAHYFRASLLARRLCDDLLGDVLRNLAVGVELHAVTRPALGLRPQVADVAEHFRQRHQRSDDSGATALLHRLNDAAAGVQVADDV